MPNLIYMLDAFLKLKDLITENSSFLSDISQARSSKSFKFLRYSRFQSYVKTTTSPLPNCKKAVNDLVGNRHDTYF